MTDRSGGPDVQLAALIGSRVCHDLAGPVAALRNGIELLAEDGGDDLTTHLLDSANVAASRLQLLRFAFGLAGERSERGFEDARQAAVAWLADSRITLDWPQGQPLLGAWPPGQPLLGAWPPDPPGHAGPARPGLAKLLLNLVMLGAEAVPRGGVLSVRGAAGGGPGRFEVRADGPGAGLGAETLAAVRPGVPLAEITARTVQAYLTVRLAEHLRCVVTFASRTDQVLIACEASAEP